MTTRQTAMEMPEVERVTRFECYVRTQFMGEDGYTEPVSNVTDEHWEPRPTRDPHELAAALAVVDQLYYEDDEVILRVWVETWIRR